MLQGSADSGIDRNHEQIKGVLCETGRYSKHNDMENSLPERGTFCV